MKNIKEVVKNRKKRKKLIFLLFNPKIGLLFKVFIYINIDWKRKKRKSLVHVLSAFKNCVLFS